MSPHERLMEKADELLQAQSEVQRIEDELSEAKKRVETIQTREMPDIMDEADVSEFTTKDGTKFSVKESFYVNLLAENRDKFYSWCETNGLAGLIKSTVEIPIAIGKVEQAHKLMQLLSKGVDIGGEQIRFQSGSKSKIEPSTLRKTAKERIEEGHVWPEDIAPVTIVRSVQTKKPKA